MTDGTMIRIEALQRRDRRRPRLRAWSRSAAGTVLADLNEELDRLGLAMENLGDIDRQTIAGAISTGTHGTGARLRNISAQVEAIELVIADGERARAGGRLRPRPAARRPGRRRRAGRDRGGDPARVPAFTLHRVDEPRPRDEVLDGFEERADANDHFEFFIFPYTETALMLRRNRTDRAAAAARAGPPLPQRRRSRERARRPAAAPRPPRAAR